MKNVLVLFAILAALILFCGCAKISDQNPIILFSNPTTDAHRVANFVVAKGLAQRFNTGLKDEGTSYSYKLYMDNNIYDLEIYVYNSGDKSLSIRYYLTNCSFEELQTPADLVAYELINGRPKIFVEEHFYDFGVNNGVNIFQVFTKKRNSTLDGFTKEERNSVKEYVYDGGEELKNGVWKTASKKTANEITKHYREVLAEIVGILEKK